jgi:hypothetical protein
VTKGNVDYMFVGKCNENNLGNRGRYYYNESYRNISSRWD